MQGPRQPETMIGRILARAQQRIADPRNWCRNALAVDKADGEYVQPLACDACAWCITGAIFSAAGFCGDDDCEQCSETSGTAYAALDVLRDCLPNGHGTGLAEWNDDESTTHAKVLAVLTTATYRAEGWDKETLPSNVATWP